MQEHAMRFHQRVRVSHRKIRERTFVVVVKLDGQEFFAHAITVVLDLAPLGEDRKERIINYSVPAWRFRYSRIASCSSEVSGGIPASRIFNSIIVTCVSHIDAVISCGLYGTWQLPHLLAYTRAPGLVASGSEAGLQAEARTKASAIAARRNLLAGRDARIGEAGGKLGAY